MMILVKMIMVNQSSVSQCAVLIKSYYEDKDDIHEGEGEDDDDSLNHWPLAVSGHPPIVSQPEIRTLHCSKTLFKTLF